MTDRPDAPVVICPWCNRNLNASAGCNPNKAWHNGEEPEFERADINDSCWDCGAEQCHPHHPGCCVARCVICNERYMLYEHNVSPDGNGGERVAA
jgi:hypothetical protein